jgi:hypothetical protein
MAAPRITITCDCGERLLVPYGERGKCDACGRSYDTARIPASDYRAVLATRRRFRRNEAIFVVTAFLVFGGVAVVARNAPLLLTLPVLIVAWLRFFRPWWRSRHQARLRDLPKWDLRAEE